MYCALVILFLKGKESYSGEVFHVGFHHVAEFTHNAAEDNEDFVINLYICGRLLEQSNV